MAFEVIAHLPATPNRLYAMLKLIEALQGQTITPDLLYSLLQPNEVQENNSSARDVYNVLVGIGLVKKENMTTESLRILDENLVISYEDFRVTMQSIVLGAKQPEENNFLLSQLTAWYASYNHQVLSMSRADVERKFHEDLYPSIISSPTQTRKIQDAMLLSWGLWAHFLGFGREYSFGTEARQLRPNAYVRIRPLLKRFIIYEKEFTVQEFIDQLALYCPELDGGAVYNKVYESIHNDSSAHAPLSLMLSTALRSLEIDGLIELIDRADALFTRQLFPSQSYLNRVSHIRIISEKVAV